MTLLYGRCGKCVTNCVKYCFRCCAWSSWTPNRLFRFKWFQETNESGCKILFTTWRPDFLAVDVLVYPHGAHRTVQTGECLTPQVWVVWLVSSTFLAPMQLLVVLVETTCHIINANVCFLFKKINKSGIFAATVTEFGSLHPWCCLLLWSVIWAHRAELVYLDTIFSYSVRRQNVQPSLPCCVQPLLSCFFFLLWIFFAYKDFSTLISRLLWGPNSAPRLTLLTKMWCFDLNFHFTLHQVNFRCE